MELTNNFAAKLFGAVVAVAMVLTLAAPAQAQTTEELQQMINDLLAQVASLQSQLGGGGDSMMSTSGVCPYTWTRSLNVGDSGMDVMKLQQFLNSDPDTRIAATGIGSAGQETEYFGSLTGAAVAKFQQKYRDDILTPLGLVNATTYFGPSTMAKANSLCASGSMGGDDDGHHDDDDDHGDSGGSTSLSGEASLDDFDVRDGEETDLEEGQEDAPVAEFRVEFEDGDAEISRIDVRLVHDTGNSGAVVGDSDPWDVFENVSLWVDGDKIAEKNADDEDDYLDEDDGSLRFSGLDIFAEEDERVDIIVGVTVQGSVDGTSDGESWDLTAESMRFVDGDDVTTTEDSAFDLGGTGVVDFDIEDEGGDDELKVQSSSADPDATTIAVEEDENSDWVTIFAFDLDSDDSVNDITVDGLMVGVQLLSTTTVTIDDAINDVQLLVDGEVYDDFTSSGGASQAGEYDFDTSDDDFEIDAGDEVTVEFQVEFNQQENNYGEGLEIQATTTDDGLDAEGADDLSGSQLSGSATGETHTLRTLGAILEPESDDTAFVENSDATTTDNEGTFTIEFDVTAFETDLYVNPTAASGTALGTEGANFLLTSGGSVISNPDGVSSDLDSTADTESSGRFKVNEGETETFTLTVEVDPASSDEGSFIKLELYSLNWAETDAAPTDQQRALPEDDFDTSTLSI